MKIKSLRYDKEVKPFWRKLMSIIWQILRAFIIVNFLVRLYAKSHSGFEEIMYVFTLTIIIGLLILGVLEIVFWVQPSLFKLNKEQGVQVCDATEAK